MGVGSFTYVQPGRRAFTPHHGAAHHNTRAGGLRTAISTSLEGVAAWRARPNALPGGQPTPGGDPIGWWTDWNGVPDAVKWLDGILHEEPSGHDSGR